MEILKSIVQSIGDFLTRDLLYILGGAIALGSVLLVLSDASLAAESGLQLFLFVGVSYLIGYCLQSCAAVMKLIRLRSYHPRECGFITKALVSRFMTIDWEDATTWKCNPYPDDESLFSWANQALSGTDYPGRNEYLRLVFLKQVAATVAYSGLFSSIVFVIGLSVNREQWGSELSRYELIVLFVGASGLGLIGCLMNRVHSIQQGSQHQKVLADYRSTSPVNSSSDSMAESQSSAADEVETS